MQKPLPVNNQARKRASSYILLFVGLCILYPVLSQYSWRGTPTLHSTMEVFATSFAFAVGILALRHYYKTKDYILLIIGTGFIGTGFLDGYHALVTSVYFKHLLPSDLTSLIPWSWVASRLFLSVILFLSWVAWRNQMKVGISAQLKEKDIFISAGILTLICFLFFAFVPLPRAYYPELMFHRPEELLPALFFAMALIAYLHKGKWKTDDFEHWLIIGLIINLVAQAVYMSFSGVLFDMEFDVAHTLKKVSYIIMFIGLLSYKSQTDNENGVVLLEKIPIKAKGSEHAITHSFTLLIALLVIVSTSFMITMFQQQAEKSLVEKERLELRHEVNRAALIINTATNKLKNHVLYLAGTPPIQGIIRASQTDKQDHVDTSTYQQWTKRLAMQFSQMLKINDDYLMIRFIGVKNNGRELVRVDRLGGTINVTPEYELQEKGHRLYFNEIIKLPQGKTYSSDITLNREYGKIVEPQIPVLRSAIPVYSDTGKLFGMIIINKDVTSLFDSLKVDLKNSHSLFITNTKGEFLLHPDTEREFAFETGDSYNLRDEFPDFLDNFNIEQAQAIVQKGDYTNRQVINYKKVSIDSHTNRFIGLTTSIDHEKMIVAIKYDNQQLILLGLLIISFVVVIGWLFSNSITAPLRFISRSVIAYSMKRSVSNLPVNAKGEVGVLARSFNNLIHDVEENTKTLKQTSEYVTSILDNAADAIISIDAKGIILSINPAAEDIFGYESNELIGKNIKLLMPSPYHEEHDDYLENYLDSGEKKVIGIGREVIGQRKDDSTFPMELSVSEVAAGNQRTFTGIVRDISERKRAEETLKQKTQSLEETSNYVTGILDNAVDAIISIDAKGIILTTNPAAENIFGYPMDELIGKNVKMLMPAPYHEEHDGYLKNYLGTGRKKVIGIGREVTGQRKDGSTFPMELSVSEVVVGDRHTFTGIVRDISERKAGEEAIIQAKEQAEIANKSKSDFLATMSHEIRTPMNGVLGMSHILLETNLTTEQRDYVNSIKSSGDALLTIINDILDFSKIEAGKLEIEPITFDLKATMFEMAELLTISAKHKNLELILHFPSNVHPMLIGDPGRIRQILMNLAGNAIKFTESGHVLISIKNIAANDTELTTRFSVEDTGIGIRKGAQKKLFNAFTQADASTTRKYGGTGLGLTICQHLVELMGGTAIHIKSEPDKGSKFWFDLTLPLAERKIQALPSLPESMNNIRVLIVDDNEINRRIYSEYLKSWGIKSETAESAKKAITILKRGTTINKPFHIVLSDYCMPEMDGEEFANKTIADAEIIRPRFILLTSAGTRGDSERFSNAGFSGYLVKPIDPSILMNVLMQLIEQVNNKQETSDLITRHSIEQSKLKGSIDTRINSFSKPIRVLLAEDNLVNQKVATKILQKMNCIVDAAANGEEAVNMVKQFPYELIFMDCQMPEMDGYEATGAIKEHLKEQNRNIPIIAMTANAIKGDREKCIAAGMDDYLSKPIDQKKLQSIIKKWRNETDAQDIAI